MSHIDLPSFAKCLDEAYAPDGQRVRYRVLWGGRGGGKSWTVAAKLILRAMVRAERILCAREFQISLADSSKKLIEDMIERMKLGPSGSGFFEFREREIRGRNGSVFIFLGLNRRDTSIKSFEGITLAWIEEASSIAQSSLDALIPTIRQPNSEIWFTYNPQLATDPVDRMFRGAAGPPPGSIVREVQWRDNPWFPEVLARAMAYDHARDIDKYRYVWEGGYDHHSQARVFTRWWPTLFDSPATAAWLFGADWGFGADPTVLVRCFIGRWSGEPGVGTVVADPSGNCLFIDHEVCAFACPMTDVPALFAGTHGQNRWPNEHGYTGIPGASSSTIVADSSGLAYINLLHRAGLRIEGARKGPDSIRDGIAYLKDLDIYVHPRCQRTIDELTYYRYKIDKHTGEITGQLPEKNNDIIDALRYAVERVRRNPPPDIGFMSSGPSAIHQQLGAYISDIVPPWGDPIAQAQKQGQARNLRRMMSDGFGRR